MTLIECPRCGFGFTKRERGGCPKCGAQLIRAGETFAVEGDRPAYVGEPGSWLKVQKAPMNRRARASIAAHESWAKTDDWSARTAPARRAMLSRFEAEVDPDGKLPPEERAKRAEQARKAYFKRLALKSAEVRRRKKAAN